MKRMDIFCASQAATAICLSMEKGSSSSPSSSSSAVLLGGGAAGKAIDRHNPIIRDSRRTSKSLPPFPNPQKLLLKKKTSRIPAIETADEDKIETGVNEGGAIVRKSWSCTKPGDFLSPPTSASYFLREKAINNASLSDSDSATKLSVEETPEIKTDEPSSDDSPEQVVVLRVSLHCRGCERKLRKHLSRMEGLTSFNIDFPAKKVTVAGKVTPLGVLSSISKVKNAQLWSPTISSSITSSLNNEFLKIQD